MSKRIFTETYYALGQRRVEDVINRRDYGAALKELSRFPPASPTLLNREELFRERVLAQDIELLQKLHLES